MAEATGIVQLSLAGDVVIPSTADIGSLKARFLAPFEGSDVVLCNFEAPIVEATTQARENKRYNLVNHPDVAGLFDERFVLSLANNHMMDYGPEGLARTIEVLRSAGAAFAGAGMNLAEASRPALLRAGGVDFAVVCAADPRFQSAGVDTPGTLPALPDTLEPLVAAAKAAQRCVLVSIHAGMEFTRVPTPYMFHLADRCLAAGATVVQFHHAHCVSGHTRDPRGVVLWGAGNYAFPYVIPRGFSPWFDSAVWKVAVDRTCRAGNPDAIPVRLDKLGVPDLAEGAAARRIARTIDRNSRRIEGRSRLGLWRLRSVLRPAYLWLAACNYAAMARQTGLKSVIKQIFATLKLYGRKA